jgi:hypothetical protein
VLTNDFIEALTRCLALKSRRILITRFLTPIEDANRLSETSNTYYFDPFDNSRLCTTHFGHYNCLEVSLRSRHRMCGYSGSFLYLSRKRKLATQSDLCERCLWHSSERTRKRNGYRQIKRSALFLNLSRC